MSFIDATIPSTLTPGSSSSQGSFVQRLIQVSITLAANTQTNTPTSITPSSGGPAVGTFAEGGNTVKLSGSRTSVRIQNSGTPAGSTADVLIYGMTLSLMNQLSTLGMVLNLVHNKNLIVISAGDNVSGLSPVFNGTIVQAYGDFDAAPDVPFHFECNSVQGSNVTNILPSSFTGATDVATIMGNIATLLNYTFENNGVNVTLQSPYLPGSAGSQWQKLRNDAGIEAEVIPGSPNPILAIWPRGGSRKTNNIPVIAPPPIGQMRGYPAYTNQGIIVKTIFDPQITFGSQFTVSGSQLQPANNTWVVNKLDLSLDSMLPGGEWLSTVYGYDNVLNSSSPVLAPT